MKKQARTLIILGAVLVLCIGTYIGVSMYTKSAAQKTAGETQAVALYTPGMSAPTKISYESGDKTLSFVFENDKWYVADNKDFPLQQSSLTSIASALQSLTAARTIDMPPALSTYGLDKPLYTLTASDSAGTSMKLLIGAQNSTYNYAMTEGGDKVYAIASTFAGNLKTDIMSMITLDTLPALSESTINTITLSSGPSSLTLDKHLNKDNTITWFVVNGSTYTAADEFVLAGQSEKTPPKYISGVVTGLGSAKFTTCAAFKPTPEELKTFGLDGQQLAVNVDYSTTTGAGTMDQSTTKGTVILEIGAALSDGSGYYARVSGSEEINVLSTDTVQPLIDALTAMGSGT